LFLEKILNAKIKAVGMGLIWNFFAVLASAVIIIFTAHFAIKSSVRLAKRFRLSDELIGMTILAIGTSIPEIMTHIVGSVGILRNPSLLNPVSGLVIGANIGSDIFQQNFVIGLVGLVGIIIMQKKHIIKDVGGLIGAAVLLLIFSYNGLISRLEGLLLVAIYTLYLYVLRKKGMLAEKNGVIANKSARTRHILKHSAILLASFIVMAFAAEEMLSNSEVIVDALPISASFFGVIILGVVAAFPELTTSLIAVIKRKARVSAGILIGSNITNPMFALGLGALISTYTVPNVAVLFDLPFKIVTAFILLAFLWKGKLKKRNAAILVFFYILYLILRQTIFPVDVV
jgi:cation:H+ antiporter